MNLLLDQSVAVSDGERAMGRGLWRGAMGRDGVTRVIESSSAA